MGINLLRHIDTIHKNRYFQCDQCYYRAITPDHVNIHQTFFHLNNSPLSERKIFFCQVPSINQQLTLKSFYDNYKYVNNCLKQYQCLYCVYSTQDFQQLILHQVTVHLDFPLLYYDCDNVFVDKQNKTIQLTDDEDLLTSDDDDDNTLTYICFFCDTNITSRQSIRTHLYRHLFGTINKTWDSFFDNWISWFVSTQHSYLTDGPKQYSTACPLCHKLDSTPPTNHKKNLSNEKVHFVLHSCFKPIKCLLCVKENRGDFWLPNLIKRILNHLNEFHQQHLDQCDSMKEFQLNSFKISQYSFKHWFELKQKLISKSFIVEYSARNMTNSKLCLEEQNALKILEDQYMYLLNQLKINFKQKPLLQSTNSGVHDSIGSDLLTDDESD